MMKQKQCMRCVCEEAEYEMCGCEKADYQMCGCKECEEAEYENMWV